MKPFARLRKSLFMASAMALGFAFLGEGAGAMAASVSPITKSFNVTMSVMPACSFGGTTISDLAFGTVGSLANDVTANTTFSVGCTPGTPYTMTIGVGLNGQSTDTQRLLNITGGGSANVPYALYSDVNMTQPWGFQSASTAVTATGNGAAQSYTIYGKIPHNPSAVLTPGSYLDTVVLSVAY